MTDNLNDNEKLHADAGVAAPDAHGQAALLLAESTLHGLIAKGVISTANAIEIVDVAAEVKEEVAADMGDTPSAMRKSLGLLKSIGVSLRSDHRT